MGSVFAYVALFSWPIVVFTVFATRKRSASLANTVSWMMLLAIMFLPSAFAWDPPLLPPFNKFRMSMLSIWIALQIYHPNATLKRARLAWLPRFLFGLYLLAIFGTIWTNPDTQVFGPTVMPGLQPYDFLSAAIQETLDFYLPFSIGQRVFKDRDSLIEFFKVMTTCALIYTPFLLFELRMSPQLHLWFYGFYPSSFQQAMRAGGYRPIVFMNHGLSVAAWLFACVLSALALRRAGVTFAKTKTQTRIGITWVMLVFSKSMGPIMYAALATMFRFSSAKAIARFVVFVILLVAVYPVLRAEDIFPTKDIVDTFRSLSGDRADSLKFRFDNEDILLKHAMERPVFGWGTFGRNQVYGETGKLESVTDGQWIIVLGTFGYVGHVLYFTMLLMPLVRWLRNYKKMPTREQGLCAMLALLLATFMLDLLPNAFSDYLILVYAGMLWTLSEVLARRPRRAPSKPKVSVSASSEPQASVDQSGALA